MICSVAIIVLATGYAHAQETENRYDLCIEGGTLDQAIKELHEETGVPLWVDYELASTAGIHPVVGKHTLNEALEVMLKGSGLVSSLTESGMIVITRIDSAQAPHPEGNMTRSKLKKSLLASIAAFVFGASADAQEGKAEGTGASDDDTIIVTATRRAERLIDVPLAIQALSGDDLEKLGAVNFSDYARTLAGVSFIDAGAGRSQVFIRGVTTGADIGQGAEATVGVYFDEVPISEAASQPDLKLFDIDRIEVLRGPQGTVYGSGSLGGTLRVMPRMPEFDDVSGAIQLTGSGTEKGGGNGEVSGWLNLPFSDKAALRVVGFGVKNSGFLDDGYSGLGSSAEDNINDEKSYGGRAAFHVQPTEQIDIVLTGIYQKSKFGAYEQVTDEFPALVIQQSSDQPFEDEVKIANLKINYDFGFATLTSATSYFDRSRFFQNDIDYFTEALGIARVVSPLLYEGETISQEVRLASSGDGPFSWLIGGFYLDRSDDFLQIINPLGVPASSDPAANLFYLHRASDIEQLAGFIELGYDLTDRLNITAGVRVSDIDRANVTVNDGLLFQAAVSGDVSEQSTTPKVNVSYELADDALVYFQAAQGYRIGGVNPGLPPCDPLAGCTIDVGPTYGSDSLWNYEVGTKFRAFDDALTVAAAIFYIDWKDIQLNVSRGDGFDGFLNAGDATSKGAELETSFIANEHLTLGGQVTYTDASLDDVPASIAAFALPGQRVPVTPKWSSAMNFELSAPVFGNGNAYLRGDLQYVGGRQSSLGPASSDLESYVLLGLRAGLEHGPYSVAIFVDNLTDERTELDRTTVFGLRGGAPLTLERTTINRPRTVGVTIGREF
ncbi:TonB-dependent receptor [Hyphococcus luteus]|uniref:TonB-dependent receptor n=1 Tax=Hyphococcus luteus TaxID=2058213 RepID=UPI0013FE1EA5|nr:TonB-dependent receptor [Marinicaulis flavus]